MENKNQLQIAKHIFYLHFDKDSHHTTFIEVNKNYLESNSSFERNM